MIRAIDREHMLWSFDLWDYDQLVQHAELFADRVAVDMPTVASGGPWPDEWVQLFRRWMRSGFKRLELGIGEYTWNQNATSATISVIGTFPEAGYKGWLQIQTETESEKRYVLYFESPDDPIEGGADDFNIRERYSASDSRSIFIQDAIGVHQVH